MKNFLIVALAGIVSGAIATTQVAGPLLAQEPARNSNVYEQLDLFGDIFERIRAQYVEEVDAGDSPGGIDLAVAEETNRADHEIGDDVASGEEEDGEAHDEEEDDVGEEHAADHDDEEEAADEDEDAAEEMKKDEHGDEEKNQ